MEALSEQGSITQPKKKIMKIQLKANNRNIAEN